MNLAVDRLRGARIGVVLRPGEPGHQACAITLARRLAASGSEVTFLGLPDDRAAIDAAAFPFLTLAESAAPLGTIPREKARSEQVHTGGLVAKLTQDLRWVALHKRIVEAFPPSVDAIRAARFDLVLCDMGMPIAALVALGLRVPCILFETTVPRDNVAAPPMWTSLAPNADGTLPLRVRLAWLQGELRHAQDLIAPLFGLGQRQLARRFVGDAAPVRSFADMRRVLPRIIACPAELEFPGPRAPTWFYSDALVDLDRASDAFAWDAVPADRPVVYIAMGTQTWLIPQRDRLFATFLEAASRMPHVHVILAAGDALPTLGSPPSNVRNLTVVKHAPQMAVLRRASVMVTHGGLNSVKECLSMGVPMVALPVERDQPGNAARIAFHKLGVLEDVRTVDAARLVAAIEEARQSPEIRLAVNRMKTAFAAHREANEVLGVIASYLTKPAREGKDVS